VVSTEAIWDGDTSGWFVALLAIVKHRADPTRALVYTESDPTGSSGFNTPGDPRRNNAAEGIPVHLVARKGVLVLRHSTPAWPGASALPSNAAAT
jgi:hypothetical protein